MGIGQILAGSREARPRPASWLWQKWAASRRQTPKCGKFFGTAVSFVHHRHRFPGAAAQEAACQAMGPLRIGAGLALAIVLLPASSAFSLTATPLSCRWLSSWTPSASAARLPASPALLSGRHQRRSARMVGFRGATAEVEAAGDVDADVARLEALLAAGSDAKLAEAMRKVRSRALGPRARGRLFERRCRQAAKRPTTAGTCRRRRARLQSRRPASCSKPSRRCVLRLPGANFCSGCALCLGARCPREGGGDGAPREGAGGLGAQATGALGAMVELRTAGDTEDAALRELSRQCRASKARRPPAPAVSPAAAVMHEALEASAADREHQSDLKT
jgi:hypothetical protein